MKHTHIPCPEKRRPPTHSSNLLNWFSVR